jgi:hypothetical protein
LKSLNLSTSTSRRLNHRLYNIYAKNTVVKRHKELKSWTSQWKRMIQNGIILCFSLFQFSEKKRAIVSKLFYFNKVIASKMQL